jgi:hypothetical protein
LVTSVKSYLEINLLRIRKARLEDLERIVDFNIQMAKETGGKMLDKNIVRKSVKTILNDKAKGLFAVRT